MPAEPEAPAGRGGRWTRTGAAVLLAAALPLVAASAARALAGRLTAWLSTPAVAAARLPIPFEVARGQGAGEISRKLADAGLVAHPRILELYLRLTGRAGRLQAGEYLIAEPLGPAGLVDLLMSGRVALHPHTVPEGLDLEETAAVLARGGWWSREELEAAFRDPAPLADLDPEAEDLEGYLFPETYHLPRGASASDVAKAMVAGFRTVWAELGGSPAASTMGMTARELVTLASLVEKETALPQEHRLVASVFHNRLERRMKMECDPTTIYALRRDGLWTGGPLLRDQLRHGSPYNTYVAPGLPPGAICSPGRDALQAALRPAESRLIFFVASGDGGHRFAETEAQHRRNVETFRQYQREHGLR